MSDKLSIDLPTTEQEILIWKLENINNRYPLISHLLQLNEFVPSNEFIRVKNELIKWIGFIFSRWPEQVSLKESAVEGDISVKCFGVRIGAFEAIDLLQVLVPTLNLTRIF